MRWAEAEGHEVVAVVADHKSGKSHLWDCPNLRPWVCDPELLAKYDAIVALKVDRLTRADDEGVDAMKAWARAQGWRGGPGSRPRRKSVPRVGGPVRDRAGHGAQGTRHPEARGPGPGCLRLRHVRGRAWDSMSSTGQRHATVATTSPAGRSLAFRDKPRQWPGGACCARGLAYRPQKDSGPAKRH